VGKKYQKWQMDPVVKKKREREENPHPGTHIVRKVNIESLL